MSDTTPQLGRQPVSPPRANLATAFGAAPDRAQGLPRLAPPPVRAVPDPAPDPEPARAPATSPPAASTRPPAARRRAEKATTPSSVIIYLGVSLRERLRAYAADSRLSHTVVLLRALNAHRDDLGDLVAASRAEFADPEMDGLFQVQRADRRIHDEAQVQVSIRPNAHNLRVIDELAARHAGGNRTALAAAVLDAFLPHLQARLDVQSHPTGEDAVPRSQPAPPSGIPDTPADVHVGDRAG